jgi:hypothetical protein
MTSSLIFCENLTNNILGNWQDPFPDPVIEEYSGIRVVRDDLLKYGSKVRFLDFLVRNISQQEIVYGSSPRWGGAQLSLAKLCQMYNKKLVLFIADSKEMHPYTQMAKDLGADVHQVPVGYLKVTEAKARNYVLDNSKSRYLIKIGGDHPEVLESIVRVASKIEAPKRFFTVGSSGTLNRGLQLAWPGAEAHIISVGKALTPESAGRAIIHHSKYKFQQQTKKTERPPFPSSLEYDSKAWSFVIDLAEPGDLFWNVL